MKDLVLLANRLRNENVETLTLTAERATNDDEQQMSEEGETAEGEIDFDDGETVTVITEMSNGSEEFLTTTNYEDSK